jgi:hypothetical protein
MSEYQVVAFRAVDGPVSAENLAYMERQSSRAEITPWSFDKGDGSIAVEHARKLAKKNPSRRTLISELRRQELLPKK